MSVMSDRFFRARWSETRKRIDDMRVGDSLKFPPDEYVNAKSSVERLNEAYAGEREWVLVAKQTAPYSKRLKSTVTRIL